MINNAFGPVQLTHTFKILAVKNDTVSSTSRVVLIITYLILGADKDGNVAQHEGTLKFDRETAVKPGFIPFEQLTEDTLIGWVKSSLDTGDLERIDYLLRSQIQNAKEAQLDSTVPWLPVSERVLPKDPVAQRELLAKWAAEAAKAGAA